MNVFKTDNLMAESDDHTLIVQINCADRSVNTLGRPLLADLNALLDHVDASTNKPSCIVFASAKTDSFINGADLFEMAQMSRDDATDYLRDGQKLMSRIAALPMITVAAIGGTCLGGGLELALACKRRVASDQTSIGLGLPEVRLGIVPAWGGTTRLVQQVGVRRALDLILNAKTVPPRKAKRIGLIHEVVSNDKLLKAAERVGHQQIDASKPPWIDRVIASVGLLTRLVCRIARRKTIAQTYDHYPAAERLIDVVEEGLLRGMDRGLAAERDAAKFLADTDVAKNLMSLFFGRHGAKQAVKRYGPGRAVQHAAVIGGGTMGAGIAAAMARAGIDVRLIELNPNAAGQALRRIDRLLQQAVRSGRLSRLEARQAMRRVWPATDQRGLELVDFVVEAVAEKLSIKQELFQQLEQVVGPRTILATNTSSLSVTQIASALQSPGRVVGLHFFNPVHKMPLIEIIRTDVSNDGAVATAAQLALRLGKTPIVVADGPGFLVNRLLFPYLIEAARAAGNGISIETIDRAAKQFGMPMGPFELMDEVGLDVAAHILASVRETLEHLAIPGSMDRLAGTSPVGRKGDLGFYHYRNGKRRGVNDDLVRHLFGEPPNTPTTQDLGERLVLPMVNEAVRVLEEKVIDSIALIDLATVLGLGFAPFRGGLITYARSMGDDTLLAAMLRAAQSHGAHLGPHPALRLAIESGNDYFASHQPPDVPAPSFGAPAAVAPDDS
jgi:3-hydroxyacyl-CoA dehydrogenase/enoyl-CoA hydratase/3-hydroxybutyryl-CoA epimerase